MLMILNPKALITTVADDIIFFFLFIYFDFFVCIFSEIMLEISCELSARQMIHMKCQFLFPLKNNKKIK